MISYTRWLVTSHQTHTRYQPTTSKSAIDFTNPTLSVFFEIHAKPLHIAQALISFPSLWREEGIWVILLSWESMGGERKVYTLPEVSEHNSPKDCWLVIDGKVCHISPCDRTWVLYIFCDLFENWEYNVVVFLWTR